MHRLYLVRHGEPVAGGRDPDLSERGHAQARAVAHELSPLGPLALVTSPLARARSTAAPLAAQWGAEPRVCREVRELPSPSDEPHERSRWLRDALDLSFAQLGAEQRAWRDGIVEFLAAIAEPAVIFTHAVVINAAVGYVARDDRVLCFVPAHTSVTILGNDGGALTLIQRGAGRDSGAPHLS